MDLFSTIKNRVSEQNEKNKRFAYKQFEEANYLLKIYSEQEDIQYLVKAIDIYSDLIKYYNDFTPSYLALAYISWEMKSYNEAISLLKKALEIEPFNNTTQNMLNIYISDIKTKNISKLKNKPIDINFSEKLKEKAVTKRLDNKNNKSLFSMIMSVFSSSSKPKNQIKKKRVNTTNSQVKSLDNDFSKMLQQTSQIMKSGTGKPIIQKKSEIHVQEKK